MIKCLLRFIIFVDIALLPPLVLGNDNHRIKPDIFSYPTGSCTDRCHVNYLAYHTMYQGEAFRHKTHSPDQGLECNQCHNNDTVHTKTHGGLTIQNKDCWVCHHKNDDEKGCLNCHADVKDYMNGDVQGMGIQIPDWMYNVVLCTDCHKPALDGLSFKTVREYCIECHNYDYGLLYDAWKETLDSKIKQLYENDKNTIAKQSRNQFPPIKGGEGGCKKTSEKRKILHGNTINMRNLLKLVQSYGMHNIRLSQKFLVNHD